MLLWLGLVAVHWLQVAVACQPEPRSWAWLVRLDGPSLAWRALRQLVLVFMRNLPYYIPLLPSITSDCCRLDDYVSLHYLLKHMAHLVQAAVWTAGLDDRLTDSGLISFQLCKAYAPPVGVKGQISTVCLYTAGGNLASKDNFILFYLGRFDGGTVFRCIMISPGKVFLGRIEDEGEIRFQQLRPRFLQCLFQYNRGQ